MYRVLIVDDQKSFRELIKYSISESENYKIIAAIDDADKALDFCESNPVDLILMDIFTGNKENGIKAAKLVKEKMPNIKIIVVTNLILAEYIVEAKKCGCNGFWYKDHSNEKLLDVVNSVMDGRNVYPNEQPVVTVGMAKSSDFTKQELRVLKAKVSGYSNTETCDMLGITASTLNYHISNLKGKTGYDSMLRLTADVVMQKFIIADN